MIDTLKELHEFLLMKIQLHECEPPIPVVQTMIQKWTRYASAVQEAIDALDVKEAVPEGGTE